MHNIHWFFLHSFHRFYQLTFILLTLSCNLTVFQWTEFWLELQSAQEEWVHTGAGAVDFNCKVLQVSQNDLLTSLGSDSVLNYLQQTTHVLRQSHHLHTIVWAPFCLRLWVLNKETSKQYFMPLSVNFSCCHSSSLSPGPGLVAQPRTTVCLLSFRHISITLSLQWLLRPPRGCNHLLPWPSCCWRCCCWQRNWRCGGASNFDRLHLSWLSVSLLSSCWFSNRHLVGYVQRHPPSHTWTGSPGLILFEYAKSVRNLWLPRETCLTSWNQGMKLFYYLLEETHLSFNIPLPSPDLSRNLPIKEKSWDSAARIERYLWIGTHFLCTMRWLWTYSSTNIFFQAMENVTLEILSFCRTQEVTKSWITNQTYFCFRS